MNQKKSQAINTIGSALVFFLLFLLCRSCCADPNEFHIEPPAAPPLTESSVLIESTLYTGVAEPGVIRGKDLWIPVSLLRAHALPLIGDEKTNVIAITVLNPETQLQIRGLSDYCGDRLELDFKGRKINDTLYLNIRGLEKITGLQYRYMGEGKVLLEVFKPNGQETGHTPVKHSGRINLVWDHVNRTDVDLSSEEPIPGLNVISPTWFSLKDENGGMNSLANTAYVENAHQMGYSVWGLASNAFNRERTQKFLSNPRACGLYIARLMAYSVLYNLDGINIDFENVSEQDRTRLTSFISRLTYALRGLGLTVSIDVTFPSTSGNWSRCYDRQSLSRIVDYVMVMAYDEHWRTSPKAGSTASLPWVVKGLERTLREVPAEKLMLGIPFYTRKWEETHRPGKKPAVRSKALSMLSADQRIRENGAQVRWLGNHGQNYAHYIRDGKRYHIWLEDEHSMQRRAALIRQYGLAGAACWRKGFEKPAIWNILGSLKAQD